MDLKFTLRRRLQEVLSIQTADAIWTARRETVELVAVFMQAYDRLVSYTQP
jgi:hypothetical protein